MYTGKDVLGKVFCKYCTTPVELLNSAGETCVVFIYGAFEENRVDTEYLNKPVKSYRQEGEYGAIYIILE